MKKIKVLSLFLLISLLSINTVFAEEITQEIADDNADGSKECEVSVSVPSSFTISLPREVVLNGDTKQALYTVKVQGDLAGNQTINIIPSSSITLTQEKKEDVTGSVVQTKTAFDYKDALDGVTTNGTISADGISAGDWDGTFTFSVSVDTAEAVEGDVSEPTAPSTPEATSIEWIATERNGEVYIKPNDIRTVSGAVSIPSTVDGKTITAIDKGAFGGCSALTSITLPEGITTIGESAFEFCSKLTSVTLPEGITTIGYSAFEACSKLTSITLPEGITTIGDSTFEACSKLTSITIPSTVMTIGDSAFESCSELTSITIPEGCTSIGENAFYNCYSIKSVNISAGCTLGTNAFNERTRVNRI